MNKTQAVECVQNQLREGSLIKNQDFGVDRALESDFNLWVLHKTKLRMVDLFSMFKCYLQFWVRGITCRESVWSKKTTES